MNDDKNSLPDLPDGWVWTRLENCADILDRQRIPINAKERAKRIAGKSKSKLYPYYGATGQTGWIDSYLFDEELVLLGEDGAPFLDPIKNKAYIIRGKSWVNNHAHVLRAISDVTLNQFLCSYLDIFSYRDYVTGTTRLKLNQSRMKKIPIPLPPLAEQHRIVDKLEEVFTKLDAGIESLKKAQVQLKRYRQAVLKSAMEGKLTEDWREAHEDELEPASVRLELIKAKRMKSTRRSKKLPPLETEDQPQLPDGWVWTRIGDVAQFRNGINFNKSQKGDKGILTIDVLNMYSNTIYANLKNLYRVDIQPKEDYLLKYGDILLVRSSVKREGVGWTTAFREIKEPITFCGFIIRARLQSKNIFPEYLTYYLRTNSARAEIVSNASQVTITNITQRSIAKIAFPLPSRAEQHKIVEEIECRLSVADEVEKTVESELKRSERLRQSILKQAFSGKLVPQNPDDEPANVLLEKIKAEKARQKSKKKSRRKSKAKKNAKQMRLL